MSPRPPADTIVRPFEVAIVGNDAVLAALPARAMQLAHAVLACGYDLVVPVSWGEEALAEHTLRALAARGGAPVVYCACPSLRTRLLASGNELVPYLLTLVSPAVATARYLRALQPEVPMRVTLIGGCPGTRDPSIDTRIAASDFLQLLGNRGIALERMPAVFDSVIPPDRRRHYSLPGGCPAPKALESRAPERRLVTITEDAFSAELAEQLLGQESVLIDVTPRLGCLCCGGAADGRGSSVAGREEIIKGEPPRSQTPVIDHDIDVALDAAATEPLDLAVPGLRDRATTRPELFRFPGAEPIGQSRARAERGRIAVTPVAAVEQVAPPPLRVERVVTPSPAREGMPPAAPVLPATSGVPPVPDAPRLAPRDEVGARDAGNAPLDRQVQLAPTPLPDLHADAPASSAAHVPPTAFDNAAPADEPPTDPLHDMEPVGHAPLGESLRRDATRHVKRRRSPGSRYGRSGMTGRSMPRVTSPDGRSLPRAYARHTPPHSPVVVAAEIAVAATTTEATQIVETSQTAESAESAERAQRAREVPHTAADDATTTSGEIPAELLERVRSQAPRHARVVAREFPGKPTSREPGSLTVFVISAVLVVALIVALAVVFRRAPTAPW